MRNHRHPRQLFATLLLTALVTLPAMAQHADTSPRTVTVSGEAVLQAEPDQATVRFGAVTEAQTPEEARRQNAEAAAAAMNAVRELGIPESKLQMQTLRLQPNREYNPDTKRYEEKGFEATREVVVTLEDLAQLPVLIAEVVQQGANRLNEVRYSLQDETATRNEALRQALLDAQAKARLMAETLGASLGKPLQIREEAVNVPQPMVRMEQAQMMKTADAAPEPDAYAAGSIDVRASVQVVFALED